MEYFLLCIAALNIVSVIIGYFDGRKEDTWMNIVKAKNNEIKDLQNEIVVLKTTNKEMNTLNNAFAKMFADNKH